MAYCTQQDLVDRFTESRLLQIADADGNSTLDADRVSKAITDTAATIDTYIAARYDLPLAATPEVLVHLNTDMAFYRLHEDAPDAVKAANDDALDVLKAISKGVAVLDVGGTTPEPAGGAVLISGPAPVFNRDAMKHY